MNTQQRIEEIMTSNNEVWADVVAHTMSPEDLRYCSDWDLPDFTLWTASNVYSTQNDADIGDYITCVRRNPPVDAAYIAPPVKEAGWLDVVADRANKFTSGQRKDGQCQTFLNGKQCCLLEGHKVFHDFSSPLESTDTSTAAKEFNL